MRVIWKFPLAVTDEVDILMPQGARVLCVDTQMEQPTIWAMVDPDQPMTRRQFRIVGTGNPNAEMANWRYIGTIQQYLGGLVWHVFEDDGLADVVAAGGADEATHSLR